MNCEIESVIQKIEKEYQQIITRAEKLILSPFSEEKLKRMGIENIIILEFDLRYGHIPRVFWKNSVLFRALRRSFNQIPLIVSISRISRESTIKISIGKKRFNVRIGFGEFQTNSPRGPKTNIILVQIKRKRKRVRKIYRFIDKLSQLLEFGSIDAKNVSNAIENILLYATF